MKVQSPKSKVQSLEPREAQSRPLPIDHTIKAAEDSRTPRRCRVFQNPSTSARFWSAAVLSRFHFRHGPRHSSLVTRHWPS